jgi:hypothetical protein
MDVMLLIIDPLSNRINELELSEAQAQILGLLGGLWELGHG